MGEVKDIGILLSLRDSNKGPTTAEYIAKIDEKKQELERFDLTLYNPFYNPNIDNFLQCNTLMYKRLEELGIEYVSIIKPYPFTITDWGIFLTKGIVSPNDISDTFADLNIKRVNNRRALYRQVERIKGGIEKGRFSPLNGGFTQHFLVPITPESLEISTLSTFSFKNSTHLRDLVLSAEIEKRKK
jgi:hypothetical protein